MDRDNPPKMLQDTAKRGKALRVIARKDLQFTERSEGYIITWIVKDPVSRAYYQLRPELYFLLQKLDGEIPLAGLVQKMNENFLERHWTTHDVLGLIKELIEKQLARALVVDPELSPLNTENHAKKRSGINPLYFRLPGWDPTALLNWLMPFFAWFYSRASVLFFSCCALIACGALVGEWDRFWAEFSFTAFHPTGQGIYCFWLALALTKAIHELSHGLRCRLLGGEVHEIGVAMIVFSPCLYCNVSDAWCMPSRWSRIQVSLAGIYAEIALGSLAVGLWLLTGPGFTHDFMAHVIGVTLCSTVLVNLNPLLKFDGYYVFSDLLGVTNLREKSKKLFHYQIAEIVSGKSLRRNTQLPQRKQIWYLLYHVCSIVYTMLILIVISEFLYHLLKPYQLGWISRVVLVQGLMTMLIQGLTSFYQLMKEHKDVSMRPARLIFPLLLVGASGYFIFAVPFSNRTTAPLVASPKLSSSLIADAGGVLSEVEDRNGDHSVIAGQKVLTLQDSQYERKSIRLRADLEKQKVITALNEHLSKPQSVAQSRELENYHRKRMKLLEAEAEKLTVLAPISGIVIPAVEIPIAETLEERIESKSWDGDIDNTAESHPYIARQTPLLNIYDDSEFTATILVTEEEKKALRVGQLISLRLQGFPDVPISGTVRFLSDHAFKNEPSEDWELRNLLSRETQFNAASDTELSRYVIRVSWSRQQLPLIAGMQGQALIEHPSRTIAERIGNYLWKNYLRRS
ncbi:HlyD family efflux transporter periplasmic adaptor subunit [Rubinisphaera sp.]|uniref:HlyD family efflux transporter periplasmic adaptor subunit n=1 Tax=Rubinisphaera sp. TaxID=2024857 RepID=UPI000C0CC2FC|nr:HlyD family efflux transporter periplasmic adaptor subunit [Rubinisphaera sp.]MBV12145.1 hypothetical protein [Rubinisphaera sp.]|tara:strand:+ start:17851 stop:20073 length:2223 start_codon:yes stop_codon:yes gene_type:complete